MAGAEIAKEAANSWKKVEELQTKLAEALLKNEELEMIETEIEQTSADGGSRCQELLYNWLIWRVLKLAFFFQKENFPVFILASATVRTMPSISRYRN